MCSNSNHICVCVLFKVWSSSSPAQASTANSAAFSTPARRQPRRRTAGAPFTTATCRYAPHQRQFRTTDAKTQLTLSKGRGQWISAYRLRHTQTGASVRAALRQLCKRSRLITVRACRVTEGRRAETDFIIHLISTPRQDELSGLKVWTPGGESWGHAGSCTNIQDVFYT